MTSPELERASTITLIANQWGTSELGRMAGWYRELFGECPSETLAKMHNTGGDRPTALPSGPRRLLVTRPSGSY